MTLNDVIDTLNTLAKGKDFLAELKKIHTNRDAHELVIKIFGKELPEQLSLQVWYIVYNQTQDRIAEYVFDFTPYKRKTYKAQGRFLGMKFTVVEKFKPHEDKNLDDIGYVLEKQEIERQIGNIENRITELKKELDLEGKNLIECKEKLQTYNKEAM